jgi:hypothetical protein
LVVFDRPANDTEVTQTEELARLRALRRSLDHHADHGCPNCVDHRCPHCAASPDYTFGGWRGMTRCPEFASGLFPEWGQCVREEGHRGECERRRYARQIRASDTPPTDAETAWMDEIFARHQRRQGLSARQFEAGMSEIAGELAHGLARLWARRPWA